MKTVTYILLGVCEYNLKRCVKVDGVSRTYHTRPFVLQVLAALSRHPQSPDTQPTLQVILICMITSEAGN